MESSPQSKQRRIGGGGGGGGGLWEGLNPEILGGLIFIKIPVDELIRVVPFVCKSWNEVVNGPYRWTDIDLQQWCRRCNNIERIDIAVRNLVRRSNGTLRRLSAFRLSNAAFAFLANCERCLKVLQIPMSDVTDRMVMKHAESLKMLTTLDISNCDKITCKGLETLGKCCTSLVHLKRNLSPPQWDYYIGSLATKKDDGEALVIADTMQSLCSLELGYGCMTDLGLDAILTKCKNLIHLDILGCYGVKLEGDLEDRCYQIMRFRGPWYEEYHEDDDEDDDDDESSEEGIEIFSESGSDSDGV
ncbi:hypothetical protein AQUCO_01400174v1 [Aquilegia coerulea]|uniref:F-box domain-containing protein n=1 Tax=Aquilegia coerulea TaxID=218851 RepID=A0A2G5DUW4_AQUCA|nr:hypothetical protein AQUCO_01400174v1 [Aquilegia coerulea]